MHVLVGTTLRVAMLLVAFPRIAVLLAAVLLAPVLCVAVLLLAVRPTCSSPDGIKSGYPRLDKKPGVAFLCRQPMVGETSLEGRRRRRRRRRPAWSASTTGSHFLLTTSYPDTARKRRYIYT